MKLILSIALTAFLFTQPASAQAPGVAIEQTGAAADAPVLKKAEELRKAGKLKLDMPAAKAQLKEPIVGRVVLAEPNTQPLSGREVAARGRAANLRFGWYYKCPRCTKWHINLAGAYAIAEDVIATCHHCVEAKAGEMVEGYLIAVDHTGEVLPVTQVLAKSQTMDAAILRVEGKLTPLPLNEKVAPGDPAFCYSAPLGHNGYFSEGIVNRFYLRGPKFEAGTLHEWKNLRVNVSTDWAPGSSGSAVLDQCGNAIGHVSTISPLTEGPRAQPVPAPEKKAEEKKTDEKKEGDKKPEEKKPEEKKAPAPKVDRFGGATLITLHDAIPARGVLSLVKQANEPAAANAAPAVVADAKPAPAPKADEKPKAEPKPVTGEPGSLKVGDVAPAFAFSKWVQGDAVKELARDKAYLVEFWATWCGPCKATIPQLDALHKKFADKGLVVIGANVWEPDTDLVAPFIKGMGDKMSYRIALDTVEADEPADGRMAVAWMKAADQKGIPTAFLVDKTGRVAWVGHPSQLKETVIEEVLEGKFDGAKAKEIAAQEEKFAELWEEIGPKVMQARAGKNWADLAKLADELEKKAPASKRAFADDLRSRALLGTKDTPALLKMAGRLMEAKDADPELLNNLAWGMLITEGLKDVDFAQCEKFARRAHELAPKENRAHILDTVARALWLQGKKDEAIRLQEEAVKDSSARHRTSLQATLEAYKKGELPKAVDVAADEDDS